MEVMRDLSCEKVSCVRLDDGLTALAPDCCFDASLASGYMVALADWGRFYFFEVVSRKASWGSWLQVRHRLSHRDLRIRVALALWMT